MNTDQMLPPSTDADLIAAIERSHFLRLDATFDDRETGEKVVQFGCSCGRYDGDEARDLDGAATIDKAMAAHGMHVETVTGRHPYLSA